MKTISSSMTFIFKFIFPIIWISGFGFGTIRMIIKDGFTNQAPALFFATIAGIFFIYWFCMRLKVVKIDNNKLIISNYFKDIEIEKSNIAKVTEFVLINIHPVWIHFKTPSDFGNSEYTTMSVPI